MVAENGAVLAVEDDVRELAAPVEESLAGALTDRGAPYRCGRVLLAGEAADAPTVVDAAGLLGLDCQIVRNRNALMVLPAGVSKGTGLLAALTDLGISPHNALAVGDAENDLALLEAAELGVAVANAVPSLRPHADLVLDESDGTGIAACLSGPIPHWWAPPGAPGSSARDDRALRSGTPATPPSRALRRTCCCVGRPASRQVAPRRAPRRALDHGRLRGSRHRHGGRARRPAPPPHRDRAGRPGPARGSCSLCSASERCRSSWTSRGSSPVRSWTTSPRSPVSWRRTGPRGRCRTGESSTKRTPRSARAASPPACSGPWIAATAWSRTSPSGFAPTRSHRSTSPLR